MLITTTDDAPGHRVEVVFGEVFGLTVRSRHAGAQRGAATKSLNGAGLKVPHQRPGGAPAEALARLTAAEAEGADAVVAMRSDTTEVGATWSEVWPYGTACRLTQL